MNLMKGVQGLYTKNYETFLKETGTVKISFLPILIYRSCDPNPSSLTFLQKLTF